MKVAEDVGHLPEEVRSPCVTGVFNSFRQRELHVIDRLDPTPSVTQCIRFGLHLMTRALHRVTDVLPGKTR